MKYCMMHWSESMKYMKIEPELIITPFKDQSIFMISRHNENMFEAIYETISREDLIEGKNKEETERYFRHLFRILHMMVPKYQLEKETPKENYAFQHKMVYEVTLPDDTSEEQVVYQSNDDDLRDRNIGRFSQKLPYKK